MDWSTAINVHVARNRMYEYFEREQTPHETNSTLASALNGGLHHFHLLCHAMIDSWPKLQKAINEIAGMASVAPWKVHPYAKRGEKPTPKAEKQAKEIETLIWGMKPRPEYHELGLEDTIRTLAKGFYYGHSVNEIRWDRAEFDAWRPRCTKVVPARYYGYNHDGMIGEGGEDRLMFDQSGGEGFRNFQDFPQHRFLIAINNAHLGHAAIGGPLRSLVGYWLAATYGLKWFMAFSQRYGNPMLHATVENPNDIPLVNKALEQAGSNGRLATLDGVKITALSPGSAAATLPQRELITLADQQCDQFILGQTLTSGTDGSGSRALGEIHQNTLHGVVDTVTDFIGGILSYQLIPAIVAINWGDSLKGEMPEFWAKREDINDEKRAAEIMEIKLRMGIPMAKAYVHESLNSPVPAEGDELFMPTTQSKNELPEASGIKPDDEYPKPEKKEGDIRAAHAVIQAADSARPTVDKLSAAVLEGLTGVSREWLAAVRPAFERLAALAMSNVVTDDDFIEALQKAQRELPEMFDLLDTATLQTAFEKAIGSAALAGSVSRYVK
jgi:phage gp29-like protein